MEHNILPLLKAGAVVLCDRYIYTAFARDVVRGMDSQWVRELYSFAVKPTAAFYFRVPLDVAMKRILDGRSGVKFYEAGMDLGLSEDPEESFGIFQGRILDEYEKMVPEVRPDHCGCYPPHRRAADLHAADCEGQTGGRTMTGARSTTSRRSMFAAPPGW